MAHHIAKVFTVYALLAVGGGCRDSTPSKSLPLPNPTSRTNTRGTQSELLPTLIWIAPSHRSSNVDLADSRSLGVGIVGTDTQVSAADIASSIRLETDKGVNVHVSIDILPAVHPVAVNSTEEKGKIPSPKGSNKAGNEYIFVAVRPSLPLAKGDYQLVLSKVPDRARLVGAEHLDLQPPLVSTFRVGSGPLVKSVQMCIKEGRTIAHVAMSEVVERASVGASLQPILPNGTKCDRSLNGASAGSGRHFVYDCGAGSLDVTTARIELAANLRGSSGEPKTSVFKKLSPTPSNVDADGCANLAFLRNE